MKTERDKRSIAFFTKGYYLEEEGKYDESIESYEKSIEYIDSELRSTAVFTRLYILYRQNRDEYNMKRVLEEGIKCAHYFNEKKAKELIKLYPEHEDGILEALETNKPYPKDWLEKRINPLFRPHEVMLMIDLLSDLNKKNKINKQ
jgi:tetratricopeptide (TPR) repeat protein